MRIKVTGVELGIQPRGSPYFVLRPKRCLIEGEKRGRFHGPVTQRLNSEFTEKLVPKNTDTLAKLTQSNRRKLVIVGTLKFV